MVFNYLADWVTQAIIWILGIIQALIHPIINDASGNGSLECNSWIYTGDYSGGGVHSLVAIVHTWAQNVSWFFPITLFLTAVKTIIGVELIIFTIKIASWIIHAVSLKLIPKL